MFASLRASLASSTLRRLSTKNVSRPLLMHAATCAKAQLGSASTAYSKYKYHDLKFDNQFMSVLYDSCDEQKSACPLGMEKGNERRGGEGFTCSANFMA